MNVDIDAGLTVSSDLTVDKESAHQPRPWTGALVLLLWTADVGLINATSCGRCESLPICVVNKSAT